MVAGRPSRIWRLVLPSLDGPVYKPQRSEASMHEAAEAVKKQATVDRIVVEKWEEGHWGVWLQWVRSGSAWRAE